MAIDPPPGERGEIVIAGPNVSPGYLGAPELTARAYFSIRRTDVPTAPATGGGCAADCFYFEGRQDEQIKLHGYRIELADIEANSARARQPWEDGAVVPVVRQDAVQFLAAFVVLTDGLPAEGAETTAFTDGLRAALAERLPAYMLPRKFYLRTALPITANGKVGPPPACHLCRQRHPSLPNRDTPLRQFSLFRHRRSVRSSARDRSCERCVRSESGMGETGVYSPIDGDHAGHPVLEPGGGAAGRW